MAIDVVILRQRELILETARRAAITAELCLLAGCNYGFIAILIDGLQKSEGIGFDQAASMTRQAIIQRVAPFDTIRKVADAKPNR